MSIVALYANNEIALTNTLNYRRFIVLKKNISIFYPTY